MKKNLDILAVQSGFTLAEVLSALVIGAMILVAVLGIYSRAENSATAVISKLDSSRLQTEVLQRIAEDIDTVVAAQGTNVRIIVENKFDNGLPTARLTIRKIIYDRRNEEKTLEEIIWQTAYDYTSETGGLILYRSYSGIVLEDKLLDKKRATWEVSYPFVPICSGLTFFRIQVPRGERFIDRWTSSSLPPGIVVTISFAEPFETVGGTLNVLDEEKFIRTIAVDKTRKIKFEITPQTNDEEIGEQVQ